MDPALSPHLSQEQADEFALGSLEPEVAALVRLHIEECEPCRQLVSDGQWVASMIGMSAPPVEAPSHLKGRVLGAAGIRRSPFQTVVRFTPAATAAAAIIVALASLAGLVSLRGQVGDLRDENASLDAQIDTAIAQRVEITALTRRLADGERASSEIEAAARGDRALLLALLSPESQVAEIVPLDETVPTVGRLVWDNTQKKVFFVAMSLPAVGQDETYQLWVSADGRFFSLGTFGPDDSGFVRYETTLPQDLKSYESAVVTIERAGGSSSRAGRTVMVTDLSDLRR
ncbi:MAG: anti-sigma factor [Dehalococcoidia bacterium]|nr:anti-sigma factor [Dehalococcoidia bacterium]